MFTFLSKEPMIRLILHASVIAKYFEMFSTLINTLLSQPLISFDHIGKVSTLTHTRKVNFMTRAS